MKKSHIRMFAIVALAAFAVVLCAALLAIVFGGPSQSPPMTSINQPFKSVNHSDLPAPS
jgi:hypothetical protein